VREKAQQVALTDFEASVAIFLMPVGQGRSWMTSLTHRPIRLQIGDLSRSRNGAEFLRLLPTGDGWALVGQDGKVVFEALGTHARHECLEFARARGVLGVMS
jgi:hypothetical protein